MFEQALPLKRCGQCSANTQGFAEREGFAKIKARAPKAPYIGRIVAAITLYSGISAYRRLGM